MESSKIILDRMKIKENEHNFINMFVVAIAIKWDEILLLNTKEKCFPTLKNIKFLLLAILSLNA